MKTGHRFITRTLLVENGTLSLYKTRHTRAFRYLQKVSKLDSLDVQGISVACWIKIWSLDTFISGNYKLSPKEISRLEYLNGPAIITAPLAITTTAELFTTFQVN